MERYYQPEIECASREQILAWQNERLVKQVRTRMGQRALLPQKDGGEGCDPGGHQERG